MKIYSYAVTFLALTTTSLSAQTFFDLSTTSFSGVTEQVTQAGITMTVTANIGVLSNTDSTGVGINSSGSFSDWQTGQFNAYADPDPSTNWTGLESATITFDQDITLNVIDFARVSVVDDVPMVLIPGINGDTLFAVNAAPAGFSFDTSTDDNLYAPAAVTLTAGQGIVISAQTDFGAGSSGPSEGWVLSGVNVSSVPEPSTYALVTGIFALTVSWANRRRRRQR